jgi:histone H3/H4
MVRRVVHETVSKVQVKDEEEQKPTVAVDDANAGAEKSRRKRRAKPGRRAMMHIQKLQRSTDLVLPRACFLRLVREVLADAMPDARITRSAVDALQHASEAAVANCFNVANALSCDLNKSTTPKAKHVRVARNILFHPHKLPDSGIKNGTLLN